MPECEYFVTCGCISPFNCPYKIEENYQNNAFTTGNSNFLSGIEKWFMQLVEEGKISQTPMNYDTASYQMYVAHLESENAELTKKSRQLEGQLKAISDRTAKFPSLEQIEKRFLDWAIPFLKARITGCKEEWFGIEWIAKAIWEFIKNDFENAIAVDETNAALRERLDKAVELPFSIGDMAYYCDYIDYKGYVIIERKIVGIKQIKNEPKWWDRRESFMAAIVQGKKQDNDEIGEWCYDIDVFGTEWWTDRAAAEKRLAEPGGESDEM